MIRPLQALRDKLPMLQICMSSSADCTKFSKDSTFPPDVALGASRYVRHELLVR